MDNINKLEGLFDFEGYNDLVKSLNEVLDRNEEQVQSMLFREAIQVGTSVRTASEDFGLTPHVYSEDMQRFYENTDAFVFELVVSHMQEASKEIDQRIMESLDQFAVGSRVLCLGDGIGTDALRFASLGFDVTYFEFEGWSSDFANHRFSRYGMHEEITTVHDLNCIPHGEFDVVINREVLEHVPNPQELIEDIWRYLNDSGIAVITESFSRVNDHFPTHLASNKRYDGQTDLLFIKRGFQLINDYPRGRPLVFRKVKTSDVYRYTSILSYYRVRNKIRQMKEDILSAFT